ncbi:MAG: FliI/YscN family ATPase [Fimbriimonadaceae bacterium]|nr:FliI/YscN family ATPase [Fimbriimonadaceae bacterium]
MSSLDRILRVVSPSDTVVAAGEVLEWNGVVAHARCPALAYGHLCEVFANGVPRLAEVVGFTDKYAQIMPLEDMEGMAPGARVRSLGRPLRARVGEDLLGRVLNGLGQPIDGGPPLQAGAEYPIQNQAPPAMQRQLITEPLPLGIRAIDGCLTLGKGQRVGIMAGSGVGKSTVLGMIARNTSADINVIALVGERGREVREFIAHSLGPEGLARSVVVVATADDYALQRVKAPMVAMAIAEYFRDEGRDVLFMMDSLTRLSMAQREIGQARGEPPTMKGYPASVFSLMSKFLERAGTSDRGSITGLITVLVEGDEMNEPIADHARGTLDGHIVLDRKLAHRNHYPAIDLLASVSRLFDAVTSAEQRYSSGQLRELLATYIENEDLINIGAYKPGANAQIDAAIKKRDAILSFLKQAKADRAPFGETVAKVTGLFPPPEWSARAGVLQS